MNLSGKKKAHTDNSSSAKIKSVSLCLVTNYKVHWNTRSG